MPRLIRLYLRSITLGFSLGLIFTLLLLWSDVGGLRHLLMTTAGGWLAIALLLIFHGLLFSGVQFAIVVMAMGQGPSDSGGKRQRRHAPGTAAAAAIAPLPAASGRR
ncbi:hypothetical protein [Paracoccus limosus]|uniref:hypothetical protein n=1 Tax=Paracoccus limosus TaxID=913252 RepID=UPI001B879C23|nr:hypothetical protein [Paracoccus limosus]